MIDEEHKPNAVIVDKDWGSTGLWAFNSEGRRCNANYEPFGLPEWLVQRFEFWCEWYDSHMFQYFEFEEEEWKQLEAYKLSLAIDLSRVIDKKYTVYMWDEEKDDHVKIEAWTMEGMTKTLHLN